VDEFDYTFDHIAEVIDAFIQKIGLRNYGKSVMDYGASILVVRSVLGERFTQVVEAGKHQLFAYESESFGGSDREPGPYEYLLAALGS